MTAMGIDMTLKGMQHRVRRARRTVARLPVVSDFRYRCILKHATTPGGMYRAAQLAAAAGRHGDAADWLRQYSERVEPSESLFWAIAKQAYLASDDEAAGDAVNAALALKPAGPWRWLGEDFSRPPAGERRIAMDIHREGVSWRLAEHLIEQGMFDRAVFFGKNLNGARPERLADCDRIAGIPLKPWRYNTKHLTRLRPLSEVEQVIGMSDLGPAIASDRHLYRVARQGTFIEHRSPFTHEQLRFTARVVYSQVEEFLDRYQPDTLLLLDAIHLHKLFMIEIAKRRGIKVIHLLPTRIANFMALSSSRYEQFTYVKDAAMQPSDRALAWAGRYITKHLDYQREFHDSAQLTGAGKIDKRNVEASINGFLRALVPGLRKQISVTLDRRSLGGSISVESCGSGSPLDKTGALWRRLRYGRQKTRFDQPDPKADRDYFVFALHSEPESALSLYGPHLPDQAALSDQLARSLPIGCKLYVKDHPRMLGMRPADYYERLRWNNPNIVLLDPQANILPFVEKARGVITSAGTAGLEALMFGVPAIPMGACHYQHIYGATPVRNLSELSIILARVYTHDWDRQRMRDEVKAYVAGCVDAGYPIGWYSDLFAEQKYDFDSREFKGFLRFAAAQLAEAIQDVRFDVASSHGLDLRPEPERERADQASLTIAP